MTRLNHHSPSRNFYVLISAIILLFFSSPILSQEQVGRPLITNYRYQDFKGGPASWWAVEDENGVMYFANGVGVLQFDGVTWNRIEIPGGSRSLAKDDKGTIFVGGGGEFGYLETKENGEIVYVSLVDKVPEEYKFFEDVWEIDFYEGRIIFRTEYRLYCWDGESFKIIESENGLHVGNIVHDTYYIRIWNKGLCYLTDDDTFELVPGGEQFADKRIYTILPHDEKNILIGTRLEGFSLFDGSSFTPFKTEIDDLVNNSMYIPGVALDNGNYVINTFSDGAYMMNHEGKLIQKYIAANGLQDGAVDFAYVDSRNVLWLMLFNGISSVNLNSTLTVLDTNMGFSTNVIFQVHKFNDIYYFGTNNGLYSYELGDAKVTPIEGTTGQSRTFFEYKGRLFAGTAGMGLIELMGKKWKYVKESINYDLRVSRLVQSKIDDKRVYAIHSQGITSFYFNDLKDQFEVEDSTNELLLGTFGNFIENDDGSCWMGTVNDTKVELLIPKVIDGKLSFKDSQAIQFDSNSGLPDEDIGFWKHDEEVHFFSGEGDSTKGYLYNKEDKKFEEKEFYYMNLVGGEGQGLTPPVKDSEGKIWFRVAGEVIVSQKDENGTYQMNLSTFKDLKNTQIWDFYPEEPRADGSQVVWMNGPDGVIRYEGKLEKATIPNFNTEIRNVTIAGDSILYAGNIRFQENLKIPYDMNTVNINYAAPLFIAQNQVLYRTQMEGFDSKWSDWTKQTNREYINLSPGNYTFKTQAQNLYGDVTDEASISFSIIPPWYKTWWAYAFYVLGFLLLVYAIVRSRTRILVKQRKVLEEKVEERTAGGESAFE